MDLQEAVKGRRSIRKFTEDPVSDEDLKEIIRLACHAPSAGNRQMWHFTVIKSREIKLRLAGAIAEAIKEITAAANKDPKWLEGPTRSSTFFVDAPVLIAVSTARYQSKVDEALKLIGKEDNYIDELRCRPDLQSIGSVIQTLLLAAYAKGLGACWMTGPMVARPELENILNIRAPRSLAAFIALGVPAHTPPPKSIKELSSIVTFIE